MVELEDKFEVGGGVFKSGFIDWEFEKEILLVEIGRL